MRPATLICLLMLAVTLAVFARSANFEFINFDDPGYVTKNAAVKNGLQANTIVWAFTSTSMSNWHPVTWLSHMLDVQLFGLNPRAHHLVSVILHTASALLLFLLLVRITGMEWQSLAVASLFALHPLHVESVAWVAERKDVLSGLLWHLTLLLYVWYVRKPGAGRYLAALACFAAGLMSKPMLVTLPVVLLLLDYWPLGRFSKNDGGDKMEKPHPHPNLSKNALDFPPPFQGEGRGGDGVGTFALLKEKIPFFLLSLLSSAITIYVQHHGGAMANLEKAPAGLRIANSAIAYVSYVANTFWPHDMAILYPFPTFILLWQLAGSIIALLLLTVVVLYGARRFPYLPVGWFWFLVTLLPVIGLIQVGGQSMADRYTYLPLTGLFIVVVWGAGDLLRNRPHGRTALLVLAVTVLSASALATWYQLGYWRNDLILYRHTLAVTSGNYLILNNYGIALDQNGDSDAALKVYEEALRIWPKSSFAQNNLGVVYASKGRYAEAIAHYREALRIKPDYAMAVVNIGKALIKMGRNAEAGEQFEQALKLDPSSSDGHLQLAMLLLKSGRHDESRQHYEAALRLDPLSTSAPINMGVELAQAGYLLEASEYFKQALAIDPNSVEANFNFGVFLAKQNRYDEAAERFYHVLRIKPDSERARSWLKRVGRQ
ncbi:MAG: tetratricopeptide repeat protein [Desulfuromonadales bacterium]